MIEKLRISAKPETRRKKTNEIIDNLQVSINSSLDNTELITAQQETILTLQSSLLLLQELINQPNPPIIQNKAGGGRWYFYADRRWCSYSTSYCTNYVNQSSSYATGATPSNRWTVRGHPFKKGTKLKDYFIEGRCNSADALGFEIYLSFDYADFDNNDVDTNSEMTYQVLHQSEVLPSAGDFAGMNKWNFDLGDYECPEDGKLNIYMRRHSTSVSGSTRYFYYDDIISYEVKQ